MRLVFVNRFFFPDQSATSQMLSDLSCGLAAMGHEIHVVTSRLHYDDPSENLAPEDIVAEVNVHRVWTSRFGRISLPGRAADYFTFYLSTMVRLLGLLDRNTILVVKTDPPMISVIGAVAAWIRRARLVNWTQDLFPEVAAAVGMRFMRPMLMRALATCRDWSFRRAVFTVVIGERMRDRLLARGMDAQRISVIHNWADGEAIQPLAHSANPLREEWHLQEKFVVGYSGNLGRVHEFDTVLHAAIALRDRGDIILLFIGSGYHMEALRREVDARKLNNVRFQPYQPRSTLVQSLGACDAHLVILRPELEGLAGPSKFYGIIAAARPVLFVGAPEGEIQKLVREAQCGAIFESLDSSGLAQCIVRLANDASLVRRWGENGRRLFAQRFSKRLAIAQWELQLASI